MQHPVGIDTCETEADKARSRLETEASSCAFARDENSRGAVADLRRVSGRHLAVGPEGRLQRRQRLGRRVAPRSLVHVEHDTDVRVRQVDRDDLVREPALVDGGDCATV